MNTIPPGKSFNRRRLLGAGATVSAGLVAATLKRNLAFGEGAEELAETASTPLSHDVILDIQEIIQAQGMVSNGVLSIEIDRDDLPNVRKGNVPILPAFEINGNLVFQGIGGDRVAFNGDMALKPSELDPFIDRLLAHDLVFQAEHQHFYDLSPMVWFIHFRMVGDALQVARAIQSY